MKKIPKPRRLRKNEGAEMGVGTLLIFIAMILVAAVAAGVLVRTAYMLQQQAEATGNQALQEVATGLKVITVYGTTDATRTQITDLYLKVGLSAGSPVVNTANVIIEITNGIADESLSFTDTAAGDGQFNVSSIRDVYPMNTWTAADVGVTQGDIVLYHINLTAQSPLSMNLLTQQDCMILIIPKHGIPTYVSFTTPSVIANAYETLA